MSQIFDQASAAGQAERPEARILSLVRAYEAMRYADPNADLSTQQVRRQLSRAWGSSPDSQPILETFLQILIDEDFLSRAGASAGHILIIDRGEVSNPVLTPPLTNSGYEVNIVANADAAKAHLSRHDVDLMICDLPLTEGDLVELCGEYGQSGSVAKLPIILTGGSGNESDVAQGLRAGALDYVEKPLNMELFLLKVQRLLDTDTDKAAPAGVQGRLEDMSFTDLVQILCAGGKSGEITIVDGDRQASVFIEQGNIIHVASGDLNGEDAFYDLMLWSSGEFCTQPCADYPERTVHASAMSLLMEGARRNDESAAA